MNEPKDPEAAETDQTESIKALVQSRFVRIWRSLRYNRFTLFAGIVWRPVTGDPGDTWLQSWRKYRMSWQTARDVARVIYPPLNTQAQATQPASRENEN